MFFSLLKWWMLKKRWFRSETRSKSSRPAPGKFGQHPTQGWSSELTGLLAEQRESGQVPNFNAGNANSSNNGTYTRGARLTLIQVPKVPSSIWVMSFSNIMKLCVYIYIYVSIFINLFVAGWNSQCIPHTINLLPLRRHAASRPQSCTKKYVDGQIRRKNCGIYFWLFLKNNNPNVFFTFKGKSMGVLGVMMCFSENFTAQWSAAI